MEPYVAPVVAFSKDKYSSYGAPRVEQARKYLGAEWERTVQPQLENAQVKVKDQYDVHLAPHVNQVSDAVAPYYEQTKDSMMEIYRLSLLPTYEATLPYARTGYAHGHHIVSHIVFPFVRSAKDVTWIFISRTLWPQLRVLYGDNVEPQLVRISERLGRYKDQRKIEAVVDAVDSPP